MRHLAFSLYPRRCPDHGWRRSVAELTAGRRWEQFDGARIVAVAEDDHCASRDQVIEAFPYGVEFMFAPNTAMQEAEQFVALLSRVQEVAGNDDLILRAHSKSCTHRAWSASHYWLIAMAAACLDYPQLVDCALSDGRHVAGAFRCTMPMGSSTTHFQGSWYWLRAGELFRRDWRRVDGFFAGVESYPCGEGKFAPHESACLFFDNSIAARLYDRQFHIENVQPALAWWHRRLQEHGLTPLCANPRNIEAIA